MTYLLLFGGALVLWWLFSSTKKRAPELPTRRVVREDLATWTTTFDVGDQECTVTVDFEAMTLHQLMTEDDKPVAGVEYSLRRRDGAWERRLTDESIDALSGAHGRAWKKAVDRELEDPTPENSRMSAKLAEMLKSVLEDKQEWGPLGAFEPRVETAYQRYINNA